MCTPQIGSRTNWRAPCSAFKSPLGVNGSLLWPGCSKPERNRPARRTPHDTITTQNKNLINRARKFIANSATASVLIYRLMMMSELPSSSAEKQRQPIARNSPKDAVNRVYARSKGRVKRKGAISVSCEERLSSPKITTTGQRAIKSIIIHGLGAGKASP